jgi:hypothetical protein
MVVVASLASASAPALPFDVGGDVALLMREEAGGQRSALPAFRLKGDLELRKLPLGISLSAGGEYLFAFALEGSAIGSFTQHHRLTLRPQAALPLLNAVVTLGAGPTLALVSMRFSSPTGGFGTTYLRVLATGELGFEVRMGALHLRTAAGVTWAPGRMDVLISLGAAFGFGGRP